MSARGAKPPRGKGPFLLAIDQGTTATKAALVNTKLHIVAEVSREFAQHFPRPGWVEHEPDDILESVRKAVGGVLRKAGVPASRIAALGIANQRETTLVWERATGKAVHRAIVWQDRRTEALCRQLKRRGLEPTFRRATGLVLDPYFSGTKLAWLLRNVPGARRDARAGKLLFGTVDSYLVWKLSGGDAHVTDVSNASRTLLMDLRSAAWSDDLTRILDVPRDMLPEIRDHDEAFGRTRGLRWLPDGLPILSVVGDQQSALFGQMCLRPGEAKCTYGTGAFLVMNTGGRIVRSRHGLLSTAAWRRKGKTTYAIEGATFIAGAAVQWLRDGLGLVRTAGDIESLARTVPDSGGVVFVPALTGLGAPHWAPAARGLLCGLSRGTTAGHIARATLEGIALEIHDLAVAMEKDTRLPLKSLRADGGATANGLLMQLQADLLGVSVVLPRFTSTTALGAAALAGLNAGIFGSLEELRGSWKAARTHRPHRDRKKRDLCLQAWEDALRRTKLST